MFIKHFNNFILEARLLDNDTELIWLNIFKFVILLVLKLLYL